MPHVGVWLGRIPFFPFLSRSVSVPVSAGCWWCTWAWGLPLCIEVTPHVCRPTFEHLHVKHLNQPDFTSVSPAYRYLAAVVISSDSLILNLFWD